MIPTPIYDELQEIALEVYETGKTWRYIGGPLNEFKAIKITIERIEPIDENVEAPIPPEESA